MDTENQGTHATLPPVIVCVDFSEPARRAFEVASGVCRATGAPLMLLHVWNVSQLWGLGEEIPQPESWISEAKADLAARLETWATEARNEGIDATSRVIEGVASRVIREESERVRASVVVVGRRGSANLSHVLLGSVSERVVHQSACPVLVVPGRTSHTTPPERLLVGVDFSQAAMDAVRTAVRFSEQLEAARGLLLVHVQPEDQTHFLQSGMELAYRRDYTVDRDSFERWAKPLKSERVDLDFRVVDGKAEARLISLAEEEGCEWLVLGQQGRTALAAFLIGSTTDRVLKLADRPVLVVPMTSDSPGEQTG